MCVHECVYECECVCVREREYECECVWERERERESERAKGFQGQWPQLFICVVLLVLEASDV